MARKVFSYRSFVAIYAARKHVIVKHQLIAITFGLAALFFVLWVPKGLAQTDGDQWLRVVTGEESVIDVYRSSLVLEPHRIIRAKFKTTLSKPEPIAGTTDTKYQTRLDTIQFNLVDWQYRILESTLFDGSGKVVSAISSSAADGWKRLRSSTGSRLFHAAGELSPFGSWKVLSYRYSSGDPPASDDPKELMSLIGSNIWFSLDRVHVGGLACQAPIFESKTFTNDEFVKLIGNPLKSLGISADKVEAIVLKCEASDKFPPQTLILRLPGGKALMLWDGVFLEIERARNSFLQ